MAADGAFAGLVGLADGAGLVVFLLVGLLGGAHCLGMCGPLVTAYADRMGGRANGLSFREVRQHALFNAGRTLSYAAIGGLLGLVGGALFDAADLLAAGNAVRAVAGIAAGAVIVVVGTGYALRGTNALARLEGVGAFDRVYRALAARVEAWARGPRILALGALHGFLPCPILYPAFLYALARGSPTAGALALGALGVGTFPTLFLYGTVLGTVGAGTRRRLHRAMGVAFVALGYLPIAMGLNAIGIGVPTAPVPYYQPLG